VKRGIYNGFRVRVKMYLKRGKGNNIIKDHC